MNPCVWLPFLPLSYPVHTAAGCISSRRGSIFRLLDDYGRGGNTALCFPAILLYLCRYNSAIIGYASETSNIPKAVLRASWEALGQAITSWVLEGHIVEVPGLGNICAEVRAKAQSDARNVSADDIFRRHLLLSPTKEIKNALNSTPELTLCQEFVKFGLIFG